MNGKGGSEGSAAMPSPLHPPPEWKFSQVFGERTAGEEVQEADIISAIEFDKSGDHLATGDRGGRVVLFERSDVKETTQYGSRRDLEKLDYTICRHPEFRYKTEFQSHEPEFDYLKSLEIEEKINKIRWCQTANGALFLLSTNDKTIKFWKKADLEKTQMREMIDLPSGKKVIVCRKYILDVLKDTRMLGCKPIDSLIVANHRTGKDDGDHIQDILSYQRLDSLILDDYSWEKLYYPLTVQEKKVKRLSEMNVDPPHTARNDRISSSTISSPKVSLTNGGYSDRPHNLSNDFKFPPEGFPSLRLPMVACQGTSLASRCRRIYTHAHDYHINSISNNSDGETFISADDLRINLWNLEISSQSFNIVDVKPANMEDLTEVITSSEFHPTQCNTLAYSSSKGSIRLIDLRQSALCDNHSKLFEEHETPGSRSFFTEIIASISDIKFSKDGRHILSRDYMTLKLWDINMNSGPVASFQVHEYLRPKLCDLYENDSIFDKFECCLSGDGARVATGSYSNLFRVFGSFGSNEATTLEASKNPMRKQVATPAKPMRSLTRSIRRAAEIPRVDANGNSHNLSSKLLHLAWHPSENSIACAAANSLYMYYA